MKPIMQAPPDKYKIEWCKSSVVHEYIPGLKDSQFFNRYIKKMYADPEFSDAVIRATGRTTFVNLDRLMQYLKKVDDERFIKGR